MQMSELERLGRWSPSLGLVERLVQRGYRIVALKE